MKLPNFIEKGKILVHGNTDGKLPGLIMLYNEDEFTEQLILWEKSVNHPEFYYLDEQTTKKIKDLQKEIHKIEWEICDVVKESHKNWKHVTKEDVKILHPTHQFSDGDDGLQKVVDRKN